MIRERLVQGRKGAGLTVKQLAEKAGGIVTAQAISKYELGKATPSSGVLIALAKALGVRTEYFFRPILVPLGEMRFRKHSRVPAKTLAKIEGRTREFLERYLAVEGVFPYDRFALFQNPLDPPSVRTVGDVEKRAEELRDRWNLGLDPIPNLTEIMEDRGIKVILIPGEIGFDGLAAKVAENKPVVVVGKDWPGDRQRMTLAHELGHLVLSVLEPLDEETAAKRFAGAFLVPAPTARQELGARRANLDWGELITLKEKYGMSIAAWLIRARDLEIITESRFRTLFLQYSKRGWRRIEPRPVPHELCTRFRRILYQGMAEGLLTEAKAAELDGLPLRLFMQELDRARA